MCGESLHTFLVPRGSIVRVSILLSGRFVVPASMIVQPQVSGHDVMDMPLYSFLIENEKVGRKILFDLGMMKAWKEKSPPDGESHFEM
jgi:hypothetical protein